MEITTSLPKYRMVGVVDVVDGNIFKLQEHKRFLCFNYWKDVYDSNIKIVKGSERELEEIVTHLSKIYYISNG